MAARQLKDFLDSQKIKYVVIRHSPAFTAQEVAASAHVSGKEMAKTIVIKLDGKMALAVLPASRNVDFSSLRKNAGARELTMATELEFKNRFPECELGAMPPFGNLFGMDVLVEKNLAANPEIVFNAGTHSEVMRMSYKDFEKLVQPRSLQF